jgi:serine/threonine protein kinase
MPLSTIYLECESLTPYGGDSRETPIGNLEENIEGLSWDDVNVMPRHTLYQIGDKLGDGTCANVYEATHPDHGDVALKITRKRYAFAGEQESSILLRLQGHENFLTVYDTWVNERGQYCMAMEPVCETLLSHMENQPMPYDDIYECVRQLASALDFLHRVCGIVHFDLKPENIGVVFKGERVIYKIFDFGSSEFLSKVQKPSFQHDLATGAIVKTSAFYRAYEGFMSLPQSETVDIWALGCIIYELIHLTPLFQDLESNTTAEEAERIIEDGIGEIEQFGHTVHASYGFGKKMYDVAIECFRQDGTKRISAQSILAML